MIAPAEARAVTTMAIVRCFRAHARHVRNVASSPPIVSAMPATLSSPTKSSWLDAAIATAIHAIVAVEITAPASHTRALRSVVFIDCP